MRPDFNFNTSKGDCHVSLYKQEGHPPKKVFIDDENERLRSMLNRPRFCHDFVPVGPDGNFYLPNRLKGRMISELDGVWMIGGEVEAFLPMEDSMRKVLKRELKIDNFDLRRLRYIDRNDYFMNGKAQNGFAHDARCLVNALPLSWDELKAVELDPTEYEDGTWKVYDRDALERIKDPMVRQIFLDLWDHPKMEEVRRELGH